MADVRATTARQSASWHGGFLEENMAHDVTPTHSHRPCQPTAGGNGKLSHRNSDSTSKIWVLPIVTDSYAASPLLLMLSTVATYQQGAPAQHIAVAISSNGT